MSSYVPMLEQPGMRPVSVWYAQNRGFLSLEKRLADYREHVEGVIFNLDEGAYLDDRSRATPK